jgi:hypothetical protein
MSALLLIAIAAFYVIVLSAFVLSGKISDFERREYGD